MEGHRSSDDGAVTVLRGIRSEWLIGGALAFAFTAGGVMWLLSDVAERVKAMDSKQDQRWARIEESQRRTNEELQEQKVKFAEFKGEVSAFISSRRPQQPQ